MKIVKAILSVILFISLTYLGVKSILYSNSLQKLKSDSAELNHFKYGLFNVDSWKDQLSIIISDEIDKLYLTRKNEKTLKNHLENQLEILIDKIYDRIKAKNGSFKQSVLESFIDIKDIKKGIPEYAEAILAEMSTPKTESQLKTMLKSRIKKYMAETFDTRPLTLREMIIKDLKAEDEDEAKIILAKNISENQTLLTHWSWIMIGLSILIFLLQGFSKEPLLHYQYFILTLTLVVLLVVGVTTPMIDMEAKISNFKFVLFDHPIVFENQVLYFQSKSVIDVFKVMITHRELQMKLVGILVVSFSVLFPIIKMFCSLAYFYDFFHCRKRKIIDFFVMKSGKWSMADVLVIAIFMAYIGFNGIINSQLKQIGEYSESVDLMTTNGTNLQPGFYLFFTYTILAMFLSGIIKKRPYLCETSSG